MGCAVGACLGCVVIGVGTPQRVCREGPVFAADEIAGRRGVKAQAAVVTGAVATAGATRRRGARRRPVARSRPGGACDSRRSHVRRTPRLRRRAGSRELRPRGRPVASTWRRRGLRPAATRSWSPRAPSATASNTATSSTSSGSGAICCKGTTLKAADRQSDAARDRDAGRDAQLDRAPEPGRRRRAREVRRRAGRRGRCRSSSTWPASRSRTTSRSPGGSTACRASPASSSTSRCPNVGEGGLQFAIDAGAAGEVTAAVRRATDLPLLVKLSPTSPDVRPIARAIEDAGADALTAVNTLSGMAVDPRRQRPLLGNTYGGLSGPAIKPVALRVVYEVAQVVTIPIVAIGGVERARRRARLPGGRRRRGPGGHGDLRRPDAAGPAHRRAGAECRCAGSTRTGRSSGRRCRSRPAAPSAKGVEYRP